MTRFCCYAAALGNTPFLSISTSKFVQHFGDAYLQEKIPSYSKKSINVVNKPRFSLAYFIVVDDANAIRNLMLLVDTLDDGKKPMNIDLYLFFRFCYISNTHGRRNILF